MKKLLILSLSLLLLLSSCGSSDSGSPSKKEDNNNESAEAVEETLKETKDVMFGLNETAVFEGLEISALGIETSAGAEYFPAEEGKKFVGVNFEITNTSDEDTTISSLLLFEGYADNLKLSTSINAMAVFTEGTLDGSLSAGKKMNGWIGFEVPEDAKILDLEVKDDWLSTGKAAFQFEIPA